MGDASDHADVGRFLRSPEGKEALERFRQRLIGKKIADVAFQHSSTGVQITLNFGDKDLLDLKEATRAFSVETLRRRYQRILDREYAVDFPGRGASEEIELSPVHFVCPECGWREGFYIEVRQYLSYYSDGTITEGDEGQQWDLESPCYCEDCRHDGVVRDFLQDETT